MKLFSRIIGIIAIVSVLVSVGCGSSKEKKSNIHKVVVKEVLQAGEYTYLNVTEDDSTRWVAAPAVEAVVGKTYYYQGGLVMKNFKSVTLKRTFSQVIFIDNISTEPISEAKSNALTTDSATLSKSTGKPVIVKKDVKVEAVKGGITIAELYKNKASYSGKTVKVRGVLTKINEGIMNKNWFHLQDGTEFGGDFDLTATSADLTAVVGDTLTLEGKIALDKDFGYSYFYKVIMEEAVKK
jgi:hypothetical protein